METFKVVLVIGFSLFVCGIGGYVLCDTWSITGFRNKLRVYAIVWCGWQVAMTAINMGAAAWLPDKDLYDALSIVSFLELILGCFVLAGLALISLKLPNSSKTE